MRPTEKQIAVLSAANDEGVIRTALTALHSLNRRAKEKRDRAERYRGATFSDKVREEIEGIYQLKDRFLEALVMAGRARAYWFTNRREWSSWYCPGCGKGLPPSSECYDCRCEAVEDEPLIEVERWHLIECCGYRWHMPRACETIRRVAEKTEAHNPDQPQREIPNCGLTIEAQHKVIKMATTRLQASMETR
ncbi:hypothetical protein JYT15_00255 [Acidimicrobium ferrooxidans]|nr:hypothetical protein [Acidimicrobium ferrooxidans]